MVFLKGVKIGKGAFQDCTGITQLTISEGVTIGLEAFEGCTGITKTYFCCRLGELAKKGINDISQVHKSVKEIGTVVKQMPMYQELVKLGPPIGLAILYHKSGSWYNCFRFLGQREKERIKTLILCLYRISGKVNMPKLSLPYCIPMMIKPTVTSIRYYKTEEPAEVEKNEELSYFVNI